MQPRDGATQGPGFPVIPLGSPCWDAAAGQHCPALGAITNIAPTWLFPQPAKAQIHKAFRYCGVLLL